VCGGSVMPRPSGEGTGITVTIEKENVQGWTAADPVVSLLEPTVIHTGDVAMPICSYCGESVEKVTDDHIPPRGIFGLNPDYNLITVPSCGSCNWGTSKDDEYFKLLAVESQASETQVAWSVNESTTRAINRTDRPKYGNMIRQKMRFGEVFSESGLYIGQHHTLGLDYRRILKTVEKTIRGLFFKHTGRALPQDYDVYCHLLPKVVAVTSGESRKALEEILTELKTKMIVSIGPKVFRYRYGIEAENESAFYILMQFYEVFEFIGWTHPKRDSQEEVQSLADAQAYCESEPAGQS
jgi:hypothetical protein